MFLNYKFKDYIEQGLKSIGFYEATEVQKKVIPRALDGESIVGKSQTGTGKTHAFILPMLEKLNEHDFTCQGVIISPTRELAYQIYENILAIVKYSPNPIDVRICVGGTNREAEVARLKNSQPQIVIGTIGKLTDLAVEENILKIHTAKMVVIDEADMVLEISEIEEIDRLFSKFQDIQVLSFSATIPNNLITFIDKYLNKSEVVDLVGKNIQKVTIEHFFIPTKNKNKDELLSELLKAIQPYLALIFANTVETVDRLASFLSEAGFKVGKITGNLPPRERKQVIKRIKDGQYQYVVASDIASRGVDISGVSHVINYELPNDIEFYIHRIGRTARFDLTGLAITFYDYEDDKYLEKLKEKGIDCAYMTLKDGVLTPTNKRNISFKKTTLLEADIHKKHPVSKVVKPGHKKKRKEIIEKEIRKVKRSKIEAIYKKRMRDNHENR